MRQKVYGGQFCEWSSIKTLMRIKIPVRARYGSRAAATVVRYSISGGCPCATDVRHNEFVLVHQQQALTLELREITAECFRG